MAEYYRGFLIDSRQKWVFGTQRPIYNVEMFGTTLYQNGSLEKCHAFCDAFAERGKKKFFAEVKLTIPEIIACQSEENLKKIILERSCEGEKDITPSDLMDINIQPWFISDNKFVCFDVRAIKP